MRQDAQSFDRVAADLDRLAELNRGRDDLITSWLAGLLPAAGRHAIDLGCGLGRHAVLLAGRFEQVDAIDLSGPMPRAGHRVADLPADHPPGMAGPPRERPVLQPGGADPLL